MFACPVLGLIFITFLAAVDELPSVDAFSCNEQFCPLLEAVWVTEHHLSQRSSTARVVNNVLEEKAFLFFWYSFLLNDM